MHCTDDGHAVCLQTFILKYRLTYPSGTATGVIINGFHTPLGERTAK